MGIDPTKPQPEKNALRDELTVRWKNWIVNGFDKDTTEHLLEKYEPISDLKAQKVNSELLPLNYKANKHDSHFF